MFHYKIESQGKIKKVHEKPFLKEKDLQNLCEKNLDDIFSLKFVKSEFSIGQFRIDTLAFDEQSNSFVIIEYKNTKSYSVIDQGYSYLSIMLNNKADFILEYNENCNKSLRKDSVDWSQSRVIFVSPNFTQYQKQSINFKDLPIELWEVKKYENDTIYFNNVNIDNNVVRESINTISKNEDIEKVNKEIKVYTEENHLNGIPDDIVDLYNTYKEAIFNLDSQINIKPQKVYIAFNYNKKNILSISLQQTAFKLWLNAKQGDIQDYKHISRDMTGKGHFGMGDYELRITDTEDLEYILSLVKQVIKLVK